MAIQSYTPPPFELAVSDRTEGETTVKQKVRFLRLEHDDEARTCLIHIRVTPYAVAPGGGYGAALLRPPFTSYPATLAAENNTLVDTRDGSILAIRYTPRPGGALGTDADWQADIARIEADPDLLAMYQGDYFLQLRDTQSLIIGDMIRHHIQQADALGRFA